MNKILNTEKIRLILLILIYVCIFIFGLSIRYYQISTIVIFIIIETFILYNIYVNGIKIFTIKCNKIIILIFSLLTIIYLLLVVYPKYRKYDKLKNDISRKFHKISDSKINRIHIFLHFITNPVNNIKKLDYKFIITNKSIIDKIKKAISKNEKLSKSNGLMNDHYIITLYDENEKYSILFKKNGVQAFRNKLNFNQLSLTTSQNIEVIKMKSFLYFEDYEYYNCILLIPVLEEYIDKAIFKNPNKDLYLIE